jgi:hypothetical protein
MRWENMWLSGGLDENGNRKRPSVKFLEYDEIVFHLAATSQCEQGGEGYIWDSAHAG